MKTVAYCKGELHKVFYVPCSMYSNFPDFLCEFDGCKTGKDAQLLLDASYKTDDPGERKL
jgi:hypothetical protein